MNRPKIWQIVLFVAALGALAFAGYSILSGGSPTIRHERMLVDISNGELWVVPVSTGPLMMPALHPDSGAEVLWPVEEDAGTYRITSKHFGGFLEIGRSNAGEGVVDIKTAEVSIKNEDSPKVFRKR